MAAHPSSVHSAPSASAPPTSTSTLPPSALSSALLPPPPGLQEATRRSTEVWQKDLELLFHHAKDRFPDVVWEFVSEEDVLMEKEREAGEGEQEEREREREGGDVQLQLPVLEQVWGHKAIVYARAPPSFQNRYFAVRTNAIAAATSGTASPSSYPYPGESALSLGSNLERAVVTRSPSPFRAVSPLATSAVLASTTASTSTPGPGPASSSTLLRLTTSINPALFANELEYLYTGKGFGEAFEFLFDEANSKERGGGGGGAGGADRDGADDPDAMRVDKLRKDLVFMWRSRLYSDVRISLSGNFGGSGGHESTTAIFSSHRFILVSRSAYFSDQLTWPLHKSITLTTPTTNNEPPTLTLPSPPFTPASLHFTLGFLYTGTLIFSHRSYDLSTAFAILKAALYLSIPTLHDEIQARIVQEMMHGLFHAFITFAEYESLTGGRWGSGGCRCRQCARRAPRVLEFAMEEDVRNPFLERGARRALVGLFGEGWCTPEFAALPLKLREAILKGVGKRTTVGNAFALLFAAEHALAKLQPVIDAWADEVREMVLAVRKGVDELLARESERCFAIRDEGEEGEGGQEGEAGAEWADVMRSGGVRFEDAERVEWVMNAVLRGVKEPYAPTVYQTLVSSILLRPHPTSPTTSTLLSATSHVRVQVEQTRVELLKWIGKRWLAIRQERGFDALEGWALKEISDYIEVPIDDLLSPPSYASPTPTKGSSSSPNHNHNHNHNTRTRGANGTNTASAHNPLFRPLSNHPHTSKVDAESDAGSSMRVSVLSRSLNLGGAGGGSARSLGLGLRSGMGGGGGEGGGESVRSAARSTHSLASSVLSTGSSASVATVSTARGGAHHHHHHHRRNGGGENGTGTGTGMSPAKQLAADVRAGRPTSVSAGGMMKDRPDSKLSPSSASFMSESVTSVTSASNSVRQPSIVEPPREDEEVDAGGDGEDGERDEVTEEGDERSDVGETDDASVREEEEEEEEESQAAPEEEADKSVVLENDDEATSGGDNDHDTSSIYHTPGPREKTLITRASLSSLRSARSGTAASPGSRSRTGAPSSTTTTASKSGSTPKTRSITPSVKSQTPTASTSTSARTKTTISSLTSPNSARPSSRGSTRSSRVTTTSMSGRTGVHSMTSSHAHSTSSRPSSRVSTTSFSSSHRPVSTLSSATDRTESSTSYKTAVSSGLSTPVNARSRRTSAASTVSVSPSVRTASAGGQSPAALERERSRKVSGASVSSVASTVGSVRSVVPASSSSKAKSKVGGTTKPSSTPVKRVPSAPTGSSVVADPDKLSPASAAIKSPRMHASRSAGAPSSVADKGVAKAVGMGRTSSATALDRKKSTESLAASSRKSVRSVVQKTNSSTPPSPNPSLSLSLSVQPDVPTKDVDVVMKDDEKVEEADVKVVEGEEEQSTQEVKDEEDKENVVPSLAPPSSSSQGRPKSIVSDLSSSEEPLANTSSTLTIRPNIRPRPQVLSGASSNGSNEHKKSDSAASTSSVATLRKRGSTDTLRTVSVKATSSPAQSEKEVVHEEVPAKSPSASVTTLSSPALPPLPLSSTPTSPTLPPPSSPPLPPLPPKSSYSQLSKHSSSQLSSIDGLLASSEPTGITLEIGIPCIISSKRKRFKAYARYIGEVVGETGSWVGVEVPLPVADSWGDGAEGKPKAAVDDDRQWNDGSWGGIRYFEIGGAGGSEWDYGEDRASRRRRIDGGSYSFSLNGVGNTVGGGVAGKGLLKREGDQLSISSERMKRMRSVSPAVSDMSGTESRGLFVRPQQVLYVVDAVGSDF